MFAVDLDQVAAVSINPSAQQLFGFTSNQLSMRQALQCRDLIGSGCASSRRHVRFLIPAQHGSGTVDTLNIQQTSGERFEHCQRVHNEPLLMGKQFLDVQST